VLVTAAIGGAALVTTMMVTRGAPTSAAATRGASSRTADDDTGTASFPVTDLKLELLEQSLRDLGEPQRNPFRFRPRSAPQVPRPAAASVPVASVAGPPKPSAPPPPAGPPQIQLRYIGLFDAPGQAGRVAIMSDGRGNVFQGKEGDIIEGRYRVGRVTADSLELSYVDGRGRQVIRLSGQ
jgi:hypothetical protein